MECHYTYGPREIRRALSAYRDLRLLHLLAWTGAAWVFLGAMFAWTVYCDITSASHSTTTNLVLNDAPILLVPLLITLFYFTPLMGLTLTWFMRKNPLFNQPITYRFEEAGYTFQTSIMSQTASWITIGPAGETRSGFLLFWGKSRRRFHWLPKSGFASEEDIAACRELLRRQLPGFRSKT